MACPRLTTVTLTTAVALATLPAFAQINGAPAPQPQPGAQQPQGAPAQDPQAQGAVQANAAGGAQQDPGAAAGAQQAAPAAQPEPPVAERREEPLIRRFALHLDPGVDFMLSEPQVSQFGIGYHAILYATARIIGPISLQVSFGDWIFTPRGEGRQAGGVILLGAGLRFEYQFSTTLGGPIAELTAGLAFTGNLQRPMFDVGVGWEFVPHPILGIGPIVRYGLVSNDPDPGSAHFLTLGLGISLRWPYSVVTSVPRTELDRDRDGFVDAVDRCEFEAEDVDGYQDGDGCPDPDNDRDGVPDDRDRCRMQPETINGFQDDDGCPDERPPEARIQNNRIEINQTIPFAFDSDQLLEGAAPILQQIVAVLRAHPEIRRVRVEGHADFRGTPQHNQELSTRRAAAVARYLREHGVTGTRIDSVGYGSSQALCMEDTEPCHMRNRRVEFVIMDRTQAP